MNPNEIRTFSRLTLKEAIDKYGESRAIELLRSLKRHKCASCKFRSPSLTNTYSLDTQRPLALCPDCYQAHIDEFYAWKKLAEFVKTPMDDAYSKFGEQGVLERLDKFAETQSKCGLCGARLQLKVAKYRAEAPRLPAAMCRKCWYVTRDLVVGKAKKIIESRNKLIQEDLQAAFDEYYMPTGNFDPTKRAEHARELMDAKGVRLRELVAECQQCVSGYARPQKAALRA